MTANRGRPPGENLWRRLTAAQDVALAAEELARASDQAQGTVPDRFAGSDGHVARSGAGESAGWGRLADARRAGHLGRSARPVRVAVALTAVAAAAAALFLLVPRKTAGPLRVQVGSAAEEAVVAVPSLVADARADLPLRFSDGSAVVFRAGSTGRLESLTASGSEIVLERGALTAHVVHAPTTAWIVRAGPYRVRVTGTRFAVSWRPDRLDVSLFEGSVIVDGSVLGGGVPLTAGRKLTVASGVVRIEPFIEPFRGASAPAPGEDLERRRGRGPEGAAAGRVGADVEGAVRAKDEGPAGEDEREEDDRPAAGGAGADPGPALALADAPRATDALAGLASEPDSRSGFRTAEAKGSRASERLGGRGATSRRRQAGAPRTADETWLALAEDRQYPEAFAAARQLGWANLCRRLDAHRLLTLADVARYSGARAPARRAFESLARRFPHDRLAGDAVFSLGRMAFEAGRPAEAVRWFRRYGADWPNGPLADEAAGRLVESAIRLQDAAAARSAAHAYLARAPHGPQASLARGVLADSPDGAP